MHKKTLFLFLILFIFASFSVLGQTKKTKQSATKKKTILFVCEHGAGRNAIAATYFNTIAKKNGLKYHAIFRGIDPQEAFGLSTKNGFIKDSIDVSNLIPTKIEKADFDKAYKVITLDCKLPNTFKNPDLQWTGIQMNGNYDISKSEIIPKVDSLIFWLGGKERLFFANILPFKGHQSISPNQHSPIQLKKNQSTTHNFAFQKNK
jgi:arsenate reductase (thioredoxin)